MRRSVVLALLFVPTLARGYALNGAWWTWQDHPIEDPFSLADGSFPADVGGTTELAGAIEGAMATWNAAGLDLSLTLGATGAEAALDPDGFPVIQHGSYAGVGAALAFAGLWTDADGAAIDCDVYYLDANDYGAVAWSAASAGPADGRYDMQSVALHELGHCLGLDHSADATAIMYAYYTGGRGLAADDLAAVGALYGATPCADGDGDGWSGCDGDCDDANALVNPGAAEVCDGVDGDCDGVIDQQVARTVTFGSGARTVAGGWASGGNAFTVSEPTALRSVRQQATVGGGARLAWAVYASDDAGATWSLVRTEIGYAAAGEWQESPAMHVALTPGRLWAAAMGVFTLDATLAWDASPDATAQGPVTPVGGVVGRFNTDDLGAPDTTWTWNQEIVVADRADPDQDGVTALCGDCAPDDAAVYAGAAEACDGADQDCDGEIDEGYAEDADADGVLDCLDPCPADAADDGDGDGLCADADPCPEDADDTDADGDGACGADDPCPRDALDDGDGDGLCADIDPCPTDAADACLAPSEALPEEIAPMGCGCSSGGDAVGIVGVLLAALGIRRRRA